MWLSNLIKRIVGRFEVTRTREHRQGRRRGVRLALESLEDRCVPATFTAATTSDLIADINVANLKGGSNTISLQAGQFFPLTAVDNTADGATGLPVIAGNDNLTIVGNGATIARLATPAFRLFDVAAGASLTLQQMTLQGGQASSGGAIYNQGVLDLRGVNVAGNTAQGVGLVPTSSGVQNGGPGLGGGVYSSGTLTLEGGTSIQNNQTVGAPGGAGASFVTRGGGPVVRLPGVGGAALGGGLYVAAGTVTITNATIASNSVTGGVGGAGFRNVNGMLYNSGNGGAGFGGGLYVAAGTVTLSNTNVAGNSAQGGDGGNAAPATFNTLTLPGIGGNGMGGGIYLAGGIVTMRNDSVTGNNAKGGLGGNYSTWNSGNRTASGVSKGGGIFIVSASAGLDASTLAHILNNTAATDPNLGGPYSLSF
jgi:hypothetical protein